MGYFQWICIYSMLFHFNSAWYTSSRVLAMPCVCLNGWFIHKTQEICQNFDRIRQKYSKSATGPQFSARISRSAACCIGPPFTCTRLLGFLCQLNRCTRSKCTWLHCARGNASVLLLYDSKLLQNDLIYGNNDKLQGLCVIISYNSHFCHIMI